MGDDPYRAIAIAQMRPPAAVEPGPAPMLEWLSIDVLVIDDRYQRELLPGNWKAIRKIAERFRWSHFSPVFVAPVEGGRYAIIDGQHRTHAAALCGFDQVPCQIVPMSLGDQAAAFAAVNGLVTKVTPLHVFRAALTANEGWAVRARDVAERGGCRLMTRNATTAEKKPGQIFAVKTFCRLIDLHGAGPVGIAIDLMRRTEGFSDQPELWDSTILRAMVSALVDRPAFMAMEDAVVALGKLDIWDVVERADAQRRWRLRNGVPPLPRHEMIYTFILDFIDAQSIRPRVAAPGDAA